MATKFKKMKTDGSMLKGIHIGTGAALMLTLAGCAVAAWGIHAQRIPENGLDAAAAVIAAGSAAVGTAVGCGITGQKRVPMCGITAAAYFLCLLSVTALFFGGEYGGIGGMALAAFGGGAVPILLGILPKKRKGIRVPKRGYR